MPLRERVDDIARTMHVNISPSTLLRYYKQNKLSYRTVDLHSVNKLKKEDAIRKE